MSGNLREILFELTCPYTNPTCYNAMMSSLGGEDYQSPKGAGKSCIQKQKSWLTASCADPLAGNALKQAQLIAFPGRRAKAAAIQWWPAFAETQAFPRQPKPLTHQLRLCSGAGEAVAEPWIIVAPATHGLNPVHDMCGHVRPVTLQPVPEKRCDFMRQAQRDHACPAGTHIMGSG